MKFKTSFIFEIIKCVHEVILSQCVLDTVRVNLDLTLSVLRIDFYLYCLIARNMPISEISSLGEKICELPRSMLAGQVKMTSFRGVYRSSLGEIISVFKFCGKTWTD